MEVSLTSKDMPAESLNLSGLSDLVNIQDPPSTIVHPHDIQLNAFNTQASQEPEYASKEQLPQEAILPSQTQLPPQQPEEHLSFAQNNNTSPALDSITPYTAQQHDDYPEDPNRHHSLKKLEHQNSKANRRGPMDEMRQLVRIMVKLMPSSHSLLKIDIVGGGNRVTEENIKAYLSALLGSEAPYPTWGLPTGWGTYLAELFTWAAGRTISQERAMRCARRLPGRSWEAVEEELCCLGLYPRTWPLPLKLKGVREANSQPQNALPASTIPAAYARPESRHAYGDGDHLPKKRKLVRQTVRDQVTPLLKDATEMDCWYLAMKLLEQASQKAGTSTDGLKELGIYHRAVADMCREDWAPLNRTGNFQGADSTVYHQYYTGHMGEQYYQLQSNSAIVPVASLSTLSLPNGSQLVPGFAMAVGAGPTMPTTVEGTADAGQDTNPTKPLRPTARSVQQLTMQSSGYQLMPSSATNEAANGSKTHTEIQKLFSNNAFTPYSGSGKAYTVDQASTRPDAGGQHGEGLSGAAEGAHLNQQPSGMSHRDKKPSDFIGALLGQKQGRQAGAHTGGAAELNTAEHTKAAPAVALNAPVQ